MTARRGLLITVLSSALATLCTVLVAAPAVADADDDVIRDLRIEIAIEDSGLMRVTETYTWDFGERDGLGLSRRLDARFDYPAEPDTDRLYVYDGFTASSPSGAPAQVWTHEDGAQVVADVGAADDGDDTSTGVQTYELGYTVDGALNAIRGQAGVEDRDELYWNATGHDWDVPVESATVTITGPAPLVDSACFEGRHRDDRGCADLRIDGRSLTASSGPLEPGEGMTAVAAFPAGTFGDVAPILAPKRGPEGLEEPPLWFYGGLAGSLVLAAVFGSLRKRRRPDHAYTGVTPGVVPGDRANAPSAPLRSEPEVAVRFTPPEELTPAEASALRHRTVTPHAFTATVIDLAVRGHLRIEETDHEGETAGDWQLVATPQNAPADPLTEFERQLLADLFTTRTVKLSDDQSRVHAARTAQGTSLTRAMADRGLFLRPWSSATPTALSIVAAFVVTFAMIVLGVATTLLPRPVVFGGITAGTVWLALSLAVAFTESSVRQRSAYGRALYEQTRGFELYVSTAEADRLRWEEGEDIFSRYLPYAIVFGETERWTRIFTELAERGRYTAQPTWYVSPHGHLGGASFGSVATSLSGFAGSGVASLGATPGSSGVSGSVGGFSGGGGGGGGGGGR